MKINLSEEVNTSIGIKGPGQVELPNEEAAKLISEGRAVAVPPPTGFLASGRGIIDRMIKTIVTR